MKRTTWLAMAAAVALGGAAVAVQSTPETPAQGAVAPAEGAAVERLLLGVERVTCGSCEARIRAALDGRPGVRAVAVDLAQRTVTVEYAAGSDDPKALAEAVTAAGYPARFLTAGQAVAAPETGAARPRGGCGGNCCAGG